MLAFKTILWNLQSFNMQCIFNALEKNSFCQCETDTEPIVAGAGCHSGSKNKSTKCFKRKHMQSFSKMWLCLLVQLYGVHIHKYF